MKVPHREHRMYSWMHVAAGFVALHDHEQKVALTKGTLPLLPFHTETHIATDPCTMLACSGALALVKVRCGKAMLASASRRVVVHWTQNVESLCAGLKHHAAQQAPTAAAEELFVRATLAIQHPAYGASL